MDKSKVLKFIGKARTAKIEVVDVYIIQRYHGGRVLWCIDALSLEEWTDSEMSHTFIYEGYDATNRELMIAFRNWIDDLEAA